MNTVYIGLILLVNSCNYKMHIHLLNKLVLIGHCPSKFDVLIYESKLM